MGRRIGALEESLSCTKSKRWRGQCHNGIERRVYEHDLLQSVHVTLLVCRVGDFVAKLKAFLGRDATRLCRLPLPVA